MMDDKKCRIKKVLITPWIMVVHNALCLSINNKSDQREKDTLWKKLYLLSKSQTHAIDFKCTNDSRNKITLNDSLKREIHEKYVRHRIKEEKYTFIPLQLHEEIQ